MGWKYVVHVHVKLQMGRFCRVPHSNQNTQASVKSYHKALKHWFSLETKGLMGCHINWLVWRLTMTMARHYMHQAEMKKQRFIKNKVMAQLVVANVDEACWISHINVISPTFEGNDGDDVWQVRSQHHFSVTYNIYAPFTEYTSCTSKWALWNNFCKHRIVILLTCTNLTMENLIEYCNTYYGTHQGGLKCMFADPTYLQLDDGASNDTTKI